MKEKLFDAGGSIFFTAILSAITKSWSVLVGLIILWIVVMLCNVLLGVLYAKQSNTYDPKKGQHGFYRKCGAAVLIIAFAVLDIFLLAGAPNFNVPYDFPWISSAIIVYLIIHEVISIIDNSKKLGNAVPTFISDGVSKAAEAVDKGNMPSIEKPPDSNL